MSDLYLKHYGVLGMKWGVRRSKTGYRSKGIRAAIARRKNDKIDASFQDWKLQDQLKKTAISSGKEANIARVEYERDRSNKELKSKHRAAKKVYKKDLSKNTTWRKGHIKGEVGQDMSRKLLSEAKQVKKKMDANPRDKKLKKQYSSLMNKYDVERARARRAPTVGENRSRKKAAIKRMGTMTVKSAVATGVVAGGTYFINQQLAKHNVALNGKTVGIKKEDIWNVAKWAKVGKNFINNFI